MRVLFLHVCLICWFFSKKGWDGVIALWDLSELEQCVCTSASQLKSDQEECGDERLLTTLQPQLAFSTGLKLLRSLHLLSPSELAVIGQESVTSWTFLVYYVPPSRHVSGAASGVDSDSAASRGRGGGEGGGLGEE